MAGPGQPAGFRYGEHTADLAVQAWGPTAAAAIGQAVLATAALVVDPAEVSSPGEAWQYTVEGPDWVSCLVQAVNEYLFLLDSQGVLAASIVACELQDRPGRTPSEPALVRLAVRIDGQRLANRRAGVIVNSPPKAATYHLASVAEDSTGRLWQAQLILDV
jgi:SHS2 domain-containing protein